MSRDVIATDMARVLAELVDTALADNWNDDRPTMALLWQSSADPDDLRIAVKELEGRVEAELAPLADLGSYLAVAHSAVATEPVPALSAAPDTRPVRITVAVDHRSEAGVLRHRNGSTQWFGATDQPVVRLMRSMLWLEPGVAA